MSSRRALVRAASLFMLVALALQVQPSAADDATWRGEYYNNPQLAGAPALVRNDPAINFDWEWGAPAPEISPDNFSVSWTRTVYFGGGSYRFYARVDDGVRVFVDSTLLINQWGISAPATHSADIQLAAGDHFLRVEYFEGSERAVAVVWWEQSGGQPPPPPPPPPPGGAAWNGEYFDNPSLSGAPRFTRADAQINFDWGAGSPGPNIPSDNFSARWNGGFNFDNGQYIFSVTADDGARLWLDNWLIIDRWGITAEKTNQVTIGVGGGWHNLRLEYFEAGGDARVSLNWVRADINWVGNIITCIRPSNSWLKIYRRTPNGQWEDLKPSGWGPISADGYLKIDGLPVDPAFGIAGQPYRVEVFADGSVIHTVGNTDIGQPEWLFKPQSDNYTPWGCPA